MQIDLGRYDDVVHGIYDAALQPERWERVITSIAELFEAPRALLFTWAHAPAQGGFVFTHNISQATLECWAAKSMHEDPLIRSAVQKGLMVEGGVGVDSDLVPHDELLKTDFYKQLWQPIDIARMCSGVVFDASDAHKLPTLISIYRSLRDQPFLGEHADILRRLLAHLSRSLGVMFHLRDSQLQLAASLAALDRLGSGVALLDAAGELCFANKAALSTFSRSDTVVLTPANAAVPLQLRLHHRLATYQQSFQETIRRALQPLTQDAEEHFSQALLLPGESGEPQFVVHVAPLAETPGFATGGAAARAIVFLYDLHSASSVSPELLCQLFDMTVAEAKAALQVTQGGSVEQMAQRLGVSANTFKTQLKAAYAKSGTHRQADLLKLLLALASR